MESELFLQQLRVKTLPYHQATEEMSYAKILLSEEVTIAHYNSYLRKLYGFVFSFEKNVLPFIASELSDLGLRKKAQLLKDDFLVGDFLEQDTPVIHDSIFSTIYDTTAKAWGGECM